MASHSPRARNGNGNGYTNGYISFWRISFGNVLTVVIILAAGIGFLLTYNSRLSSVEGSRDETRRNIDALVQSIKEMNDHGTTYSRSGIPLETAAISGLNDRVTAHDRFVAEVGPKLEHISTALQFVSDWIKEQDRSRPRSP